MFKRQMSIIDENEVVDCKGASSKGMMQVNNRRALGDIGNLVGALSVRCNVTGKEATHEDRPFSKQQPAAVDRPLTRTYSANFNELGRPVATAFGNVVNLGEASTWGTKQRRTNASYRLRDAPALPPTVSSHESASTSEMVNAASFCEVSNSSVPTTSSSILPSYASIKELVHRNVRIVKKKEQTLTALLTARSEAADAEMHDAEEDFVNIDEDDIGNPLAVVDYVEDIYSFYRRAEVLGAISGDYMSSQTDINAKMRSILIDWLIEVHCKFKLMPETLFLTVNLIDRFLSCQRVFRKHLQLVGVTAMLIAAKYEEVWAPEVQDFVYITDNAYTREEILDMEKKILNTVNFNLTVPTPYVFVVRFLKAASSNSQMDQLAFFLVELCLVEYSMVKYPASLLAAAAIYTAQCTLQKSPSWSNVLQRHFGYSEGQLLECAKMMVSFHRNAAQGSLTVVYKKYASSKLHCVSLLWPAVL